MTEYKYQIFFPGGNKTALVLRLDDQIKKDEKLRKIVQDAIFAKHKQDKDGKVEQVGFINPDKSVSQLMMAGGEFCGNAARSAVKYYFNESRQKEIDLEILLDPEKETSPQSIQTNFESLILHGEVNSNNVRVQMPLLGNLLDTVIPVENRFYWVKIKGISHLIVPQTQFNLYFKTLFESRLDDPAIIAGRLLNKILKENSFELGNACGIIFLEDVVNILKMHPFVFVKKSGTTFYETGCGSGAMCVGLVSSKLRDGSVDIPLLQPSGKIITAEVSYKNGGAVEGKISGVVEEYVKKSEVDC